ncbi:MAG: hypothetical protein AB7F88_17040 [Pyrinomonadaceae bacterium]
MSKERRGSTKKEKKKKEKKSKKVRKMDELEIELENAKLAYTIIESLLAGHAALSDLLVVMAHALDEDMTKGLTMTNEWHAYLESKRTLENTRKQIEIFTDYLKRLDQ